MVDPGFFIILDRLHGTLNERINTWNREHKRHSGLFRSNKKILQQLLVDRMTVAYDLAAAFFYLHENRLVYRDIKVRSDKFFRLIWTEQAQGLTPNGSSWYTHTARKYWL